MENKQMADYILTIKADSGYESTTEGRCTAEQYGQAIAALHGEAPQRKPLTDEELRLIENKINPNMRWRSSDEEGITLYPQEYYELVRAIEAAHGIKE